MNRSRCKICSFLRNHSFAKSQWDNEVNRGDSLGELQTVLRTLGLGVSRSTISRHLVQCENLELYETKTAKIKKAMKSPFKKLNNFFIRPIVETPSSKCKHLRTTKFWNMTKERVFIKCKDCGEILGSFDPEAKPRERSNRDITIINALRESRRMRERRNEK